MRIPSSFFLSQLLKALRLAQYVYIGRYVCAHSMYFIYPGHATSLLLFDGRCFGDDVLGTVAWHMQTSAMVKGKEPTLEKNGCCRSGLRDVSM